MSLDDELSELTDLESEDEEYQGPKKKAGDRTKSGYKIRNALKVPRATTYTAQALFCGFSICLDIPYLTTF